MLYIPELADDPVALRKACYKTKGIVFPRQSMVTREFLDFLPKLKAVARLHVGTDNTDLEACKERDIKVIHASSANLRSNAEYLLATLLLMYRRGIVSSLLTRRCMGSKIFSSRHAWAPTRVRRDCAPAGMWRIACMRPFQILKAPAALASCRKARPWIWNCRGCVTVAVGRARVDDALISGSQPPHFQLRTSGMSSPC